MAKANDKIIPITCTSSAMVEAESLTPLQGNLKDKTKIQLQKLRNQIFRHGFSFPIFIWQNKNKNYTIDGHGREYICKELIKEGYLFQRNGDKPSTKIPADFIDAKNRIEAKEKLLALNSSFGKITEEGLYEFLNEPDYPLDFDSIKNDIELSDINRGYFDHGFTPEHDRSGEEDSDSLNECPKCGYKW